MQKSGPPPRALTQCHWSEEVWGTPTNFLGDESFAMTYMQRTLKYYGKRSSQSGSLKDLGYMEFVLVKSKLEKFGLYEEFLVK